VQADAAPGEEVVVRRRVVELRYQGQDSVLEVTGTDPEELRTGFEQRYREIYGYLPEARPLEVVALRAVASTRPPKAEGVDEPEVSGAPEPVVERRAWLGGGWRLVAVYDRETLAPGATAPGPALVVEAHASTVVEAGWRVTVGPARALRLTRERG
jgi:5-oxoprolinase (ATP-hydrolysing)